MCSILTPWQYVHPSNGPASGSHILSLLPSEPVNPELAIGLTTQLPPTTDTFKENPKFLNILQEVCSEHAVEDPDAKSQAQVMVSIAGANLNSGGVLMGGKRGRRRRNEMGDSSGGASGQGGAGSGGRGGWIHVSDGRRPPDYGRIAWYVGFCSDSPQPGVSVSCTDLIGRRICLEALKLIPMVNLLGTTETINQVVCIRHLGIALNRTNRHQALTVL